MLTFRVQGQIYYHAGSLLPLPDADHKLLQIYFMANGDEQIEQRCHYNAGTRREIVGALQGLFDQHNELVRLFKTAIQRMPADDYAVVIRADKRPVGQHERQFNAPTIDEVAIVIVGEEFESRDIILHRRSGDIQRVSKLIAHIDDGLQYPILFWRGDDEYHF
ncbi:helitron_like_N domain-containing protein [Trichonephila clavipes]|nr:helitron_like_N domain-containing protein [Trichonephila clavipes]